MQMKIIIKGLGDMKNRSRFDTCSFIKNMFFGIMICAVAVASAVKLAGNKTIQTANVIKNNSDTLFDEKTSNNTYSDSDPVYTDTLTREELAIQPETDINLATDDEKPLNITEADIGKLKNFNYLKNNFYIVDSRTQLNQSDIDIDRFMKMDLSIDKSTGGPKVLIFHTHSCEMYADSDTSKGLTLSEGVWGVGEELKKQLEARGIEVIHDSGRYDLVNGKRSVLGAYERMEPNIEKILKDNPSIEVCIDIHRDGVPDNVHRVETINGKQCADVMLFNGLCRLNENGQVNPIDSLPNPNLDTNLALSFRVKLAANKLYPTLTRKIYLNAYRYSLNMKPKSMLVEVGAQTNTKEEALNAMMPFADVLSRVILSE
jgi:stage II sporulation protein P